MRLYVQNPRWCGTTIFRQSNQFTGLIGPHSWSNFPHLDYDWLLCHDPARLPDCLRCIVKERRVFIMAENPAVWKPDKSFLEQFGVVISPFFLEVPDGVVQLVGQPAVAWFYGIPFRTDCGLLHVPQKTSLELCQLRGAFPRKKTKLLSVIVSGKNGLPGHRWRLRVADAMKKYFGNDVDIYGFGHRPLADKATALDDYLYTVVIENDRAPHYWTEKISDSLIAGCTPIYSGAPNISHYLETDLPSITWMCDPEIACHQIKNHIDKPRLITNDILRARDLILDKYNLLAYITAKS